MGLATCEISLNDIQAIPCTGSICLFAVGKSDAATGIDLGRVRKKRNDAPVATRKEFMSVSAERAALPKAFTSARLGSGGIQAVIWSTGYDFDFSFVKLPVTDEAAIRFGSEA